MQPRRLVVRAVNWVGDAVLTLPAIRDLQQSHPNTEVTVFARPAVAAVYRREPGLRVVEAAKSSRLKALQRNVHLLRRGRYEAGILFTNSFCSALEFWAARIPRRIGYIRDGRGPLLTVRVDPPPAQDPPRHERYYYLELLVRSGYLPELREVPHILLAGLEEGRERGAAVLGSKALHSPVIGVSPGATNSRAKQWPPERFAAASIGLAKRTGGSVALFGAPAEQDLCQEISASVQAAGAPSYNFAGATSLDQFIDLAAACDVFLTNDSGAMHIASAAGTPTVAIFGPTNEFTTGPAGPNTVLVREEVECMRCMYRDCPIDHRCMLRVDPERVVQAALTLLEDRGR